MTKSHLEDGSGAGRRPQLPAHLLRTGPLGFLGAALAVLLLVGCAEAPGTETNTWHTSPIEETRPLFTEHFAPEEFASRRDRVLEEIGPDAIAVIQGAPSPMGFIAFRQSNEFFHLTGIESPHAYLVLDGRSGEETLYLPNRLERREYGEGKVLSAEDGDLVRELAGIERVRSVDDLRSDLR